MNNKHGLSLIIIMILSFTLLASCDGDFKLFSSHSHKPHKVKLQIDETNKVLKVKTGPSGNCRGNGCVFVAQRDEAEITFHIIRSSGWYFSEFKVCQGDTKPANCSLETWQLSQFEVTTKAAGFPKSDGVIELALSDRLKKFVVYDYNGPAQDYFYIITACKTADGISICYKTDPTITNKGRT